MKFRVVVAGGVLVGSLGMLALTLPVSAADAAANHDAMVVIAAGSGTVTTIRFEFPTNTRTDQSSAVIDAVRRALGTDARPGRAVVKNGVRRYNLDVNVARRQGFAESRIPASVWREISAAAHEPVALEIRGGFHVVAGDVAKVHGGMTSRFNVVPDRDVVYGMGAPMLWSYVLSLIAIAVFGFAILRPWARRIEHRTDDVVDRAHLLQRISMATVLGMLVLVGVELFTGLLWVLPVIVAGVFPRTDGWRWLMVVSAGFGIIVPIMVWGLAVGLAIQPSYRRLRGIDRKPSRRTRLGFLAMSVAPITFITAARLVGSNFGTVGTVFGVVFSFAFILLLWPSLLVRILPTRAPSSDLEARFRARCGSQKTRIRGVRILEGKRTKTANAMLLGVGRFRYVLITDYLLDNLEPDSLDAVMLHEIAHAKQHHLLKKLGAAIAGIALFEAVLVGAVSLLHLPAGVVTVGLVFGVPASFLLTNGWLGIRLETKADDYAAEVVGPDALRRGLDCLAQLNMTKRRSGPVWNLLTQHPGVQQRLDRLAAQESGTGRRMPAPTKRDDPSGDRREDVVAATRTRP